MNCFHRRLCSVLGVLVCVVLAAGAWLLWPRTAITAANAARIQQGMSLADVEAILGGPPREEMTGPVVTETDWDALKRAFRDVERRPILVWGSDHARIFVQFTSDERVSEVIAVPVHRIAP